MRTLNIGKSEMVILHGKFFNIDSNWLLQSWFLFITQILVGSHKAGRVDHIRIGDQVGADPERVKQVIKFCPLLEVEMDPGDCIFFHCNLLHKA